MNEDRVDDLYTVEESRGEAVIVFHSGATRRPIRRLSVNLVPQVEVEVFRVTAARLQVDRPGVVIDVSWRNRDGGGQLVAGYVGDERVWIAGERPRD